MTANEARIHRWRQHWTNKWRRRYVFGVVSTAAMAGVNVTIAEHAGVPATLMVGAIAMGVVFGLAGRTFSRQDRREEYAMLSGREPPRPA